MEVEILKGDITSLKVDAIVNAANSTLLGGGGVDGAIHKAAGKLLHQECLVLNMNGGCPTGEVKITRGGDLPCNFVLHAVGVDCRRYQNPSEEDKQEMTKLLASCYRNSLHLADKFNCETIAFPNISTGVFGFDKVKAAKIAFSVIRVLSSKNRYPNVKKVIFCCFDDDNFLIYKRILEKTEQIDKKNEVDN